MGGDFGQEICYNINVCIGMLEHFSNFCHFEIDGRCTQCKWQKLGRLWILWIL